MTQSFTPKFLVAATLLVALSDVALAQNTPIGLLEAEQAAFRQAVLAVAPGVVQIETFGGLEKVDAQVVSEGLTTGTIIDRDGWIVSSLYSLRQQPASILVGTPSGKRVPAKIVARDYARELALLKIETEEELTPVQPSQPSSWEVGQWCVAVGKTYDNREVTQTVGIISALGRAYGRAVQTDAKVSPINYGGPLIDLEGKVIGILAPIAAAEMLEDDATMLYDSGIGFAIPLADILQRLPRMQAGKDIRPGKLGIVTKIQNELSGPVKLTGAAPGTPAARAGANAGDVLIEAQGQPIELLADLRAALARVDAGEEFQFQVRRGDQVLPLSCELVSEVPIYRRRYLGMKVSPVDSGLKIQMVDANSPAELATIKVGEVITACDGQPLRTEADLVGMLAVAELEATLKLVLTGEDGKSTREVQVRPATWPTDLIDVAPEKFEYLDAEGKELPNTAAVGAELKLADIPNAIHAIIPPQPQSRPLGCLLVLPEPGPVDAEKLNSQWQSFAKDYGWIVVVPSSANPKGWSRDEVMELPERLMARLAQDYQLDPSRRVIGGIGVGGVMALRSAISSKAGFAAVLTIAAPPIPFSVPRPSMPLSSVDFLMVGEKHEAIVERLNAAGYVANAVSPPGLDPAKWESVPMDTIIKWLESLGHI